MSTTQNLPADCLPIIPDAEFSKVSADQILDKVQEKYGDEDCPSANAYRKIASMFAAGQRGGIGAPKNVTYWAWRTLTDEDEKEVMKSEARLAIASRELDAPIFMSDVTALDEMIEHIDAGEELTEEETEIFDTCKSLALKWIDVAVRTKSSRRGSKGKKTTAAA